MVCSRQPNSAEEMGEWGGGGGARSKGVGGLWPAAGGDGGGEWHLTGFQRQHQGNFCETA